MSSQDSDNIVNMESIKMLELFPVRKIQCLQFDSQKYHKLYELLTCTFCRQIFNNPTYLKCSHRFCKECIQKYIRLNDKKSCPICRGELATKRDSKADLKLISLISFAFGDAVMMQEQINRCEEQALKSLKFVKTRNGIQMQLKRNRQQDYMETRSRYLETPSKKRSKRQMEDQNCQPDLLSQSKDNMRIIEETPVANQNIQKQMNFNQNQILSQFQIQIPAPNQSQVQQNNPVKIQGNPETDSKLSSNSKKSGKSGVGWGNTRIRNSKKNDQIIQILSEGSQDAPLQKSIDKSMDKSISKSMSNIQQSINNLQQKGSTPTYQKYNKNDAKNDAKYLRSIHEKILQLQSQNQASQSQLLYQPFSTPKPIPSPSHYFAIQTPSQLISYITKPTNSSSAPSQSVQPSTILIPISSSSSLSKQPTLSIPPTPLIKTPQMRLFQSNTSNFSPSLLTDRNKLQQFLTPEKYLPTLIQKFSKKLSFKVMLKPNPYIKNTIMPVPWGFSQGVELSLKTTIGNVKNFILNKINKSLQSSFVQGDNIKISQIIQINIIPQNLPLPQQSTNKKQQPSQQQQLVVIDDSNMTVLNLLQKYWHNYKDIQFFNIKNRLSSATVTPTTINKQKQNRQPKILYYTIKYDCIFRKM